MYELFEFLSHILLVCHAERSEASRMVPWQNPCARSFTMFRMTETRLGYLNKIKKGKQLAYKPGSVLCLRIASVIYLCLLLPAGYSGLPSGSGEQPSGTGIHDLATPGTHSSGCHHPDWWALAPPSHPYLV